MDGARFPPLLGRQLSIPLSFMIKLAMSLQALWSPCYLSTGRSTEDGRPSGFSLREQKTN